jgi:hypothetical protein
MGDVSDAAATEAAPANPTIARPKAKATIVRLISSCMEMCQGQVHDRLVEHDHDES